MPTKKLKEAILLNGVVATATGTWIDVTAWNRITVDILGITTATCQIFSSCAPTKPADATDGRQIGSNITADASSEITRKLKWLKVKVSAWTAGTIYAYAVGDETAYGM